MVILVPQSVLIQVIAAIGVVTAVVLLIIALNIAESVLIMVT
jgi:hypothetical protein